VNQWKKEVAERLPEVFARKTDQEAGAFPDGNSACARSRNVTTVVVGSSGKFGISVI
jgi:hypothetical protein